MRHNRYTNGKANGLLNGIRTAKMEVTRNIPSSLKIEGHNVVFLYNGQRRTCFTCGRDTHMAADCVMDNGPKSNVYDMSEFPLMVRKNVDEQRNQNELTNVYNHDHAVGQKGNIDGEGNKMTNFPEEIKLRTIRRKRRITLQAMTKEMRIMLQTTNQ